MTGGVAEPSDLYRFKTLSGNAIVKGVASYQAYDLLVTSFDIKKTKVMLLPYSLFFARELRKSLNYEPTDNINVKSITPVNRDIKRFRHIFPIKKA